MPELLGICDRIYVMNEGRIVGEMPASEASQEKIMRAIVRGEGKGIMSTETTHRTADRRRRRRPRPRVAVSRHNLREYGLLLALIAIMVFFQFTTNGMLFKPVNLTNLVLQNSYIIIMALGMLLVIVAGHIDLSVGSVAGFIGALAAVMMVDLARSALSNPLVVVDRLPRRRRRRSARRRATGSPITASRPSSSRWPACWSSAACRWRCSAAAVGRAASRRASSC